MVNIQFGTTMRILKSKIHVRNQPHVSPFINMNLEENLEGLSLEDYPNISLARSIKWSILGSMKTYKVQL